MFDMKSLFGLVLAVGSAEVRMRVFELLTALCVYSDDGYELVLKSLARFPGKYPFSFHLENRTRKIFSAKTII